MPGHLPATGDTLGCWVFLLFSLSDPEKNCSQKSTRALPHFFWNTHHGYDGQNLLLGADQLSVKQKRGLELIAHFWNNTNAGRNVIKLSHFQTAGITGVNS